MYITENPLLDPNSMDSHLIRGIVIDLDNIKPQTDLEAQVYSWDTFLQLAKMWDLLISKGMLALTFWNVMVFGTGLTFLEYKNNTELNIQK